MSRAILFDVMDTLVADPFFDRIPTFFRMSLDQLIAEKHPTAWVDFERGSLTAEQYYASMFADGRSVDTVGLERTLKTGYRWIDGIEGLLSELSARDTEMHALSNYPTWYRWIEERLGLSRYVAWSFVSCETGRRKPDPAAYLEAARELGRDPAECLFVDDRESNCSAAESVGMPAVRFENAESLRRALIARGVL